MSALIRKATRQGRTDCRLALSPQFVEGAVSGVFYVHTSGAVAEDQAEAAAYVAGYRAALRGVLS